MSDEQQSPSEPVQAADISLSHFLESVSPGQFRLVTASVIPRKRPDGRTISAYRVRLPEIQLHCPSDACNREMFFRTEKEYLDFQVHGRELEYVEYLCANCQKYLKTFSLRLDVEMDAQENYLGLTCYKFGELPPYGPPTPSRLISLLGPGRDFFLKGRRCENQGLGVGAFVYYRRVVEDQKNRILTQIAKVAETVGAPPETVCAQGSPRTTSIQQGDG
jgi:hypothetical protein